jgi:hypothetical protein
VTVAGALVVAAKTDRNRRNGLRMSRRIDAARSGAVRMSSVRRDRGVMVEEVMVLLGTS